MSTTKKSLGQNLPYYGKKILQSLQNYGMWILQAVRDSIAEGKDEACINERQNNIATATVAMREAGLSDEIITSMLQKHWDLRQSEAGNFIDWAHSRIPENCK